MTAAQLPLFPPEALPEMAVPVAEWSDEWRAAQMLRLVEGLRFDPARLAAYEATVPTGRDFRDFLDFVIWQCGGRSQ